MSAPAVLRALRARVSPQRRRMSKLYEQFLAPGDLSFDVGANVGARVEAMRAVGARVVAIEPQPSCINTLRRRFSDDRDVVILDVGMAEADGTRELRTASLNVLSSMSDEWIDAVTASGRFERSSWDERLRVRVITLDSVIAEYGCPQFCKIDVEGYERKVLEGLSTPIPALSFEYAREASENAVACMNLLAELSEYEFCYSPGESMDLSDGWHSCAEQRRLLTEGLEPLAWGDIYARLVRR